MKTLGRKIIWALISAIVCRESSAGVIETLNNTIGIVIDGSRADWINAVAYTNDAAGEGEFGPSDVDWKRITIANGADLGTIYFRLEMNVAADFNNFPAYYNVFIDTDEDRGTGYIGTDSQLPIGAEYLIQGPNLFSFSGGAQTDFGWTFVQALSSDNSFANFDVSIALPAALIGSPADFNFVLLGDNTLSVHTPDYYPDGGNLGAGGDYFEYELLIDPAGFDRIALQTVTAFSVSNSLTNVTYRLEFAPVASPTNWNFSGCSAVGNGAGLYLFDPAGYSTARVYRVIAEY